MMKRKIPRDPYLSHLKVVDRLIKEVKKYDYLIIGFDFDDTIYDYHGEGYKYDEVINLLKRAKEYGFILCLYTVEPDPKKLQWKIDYCTQLGIEPDYVNESPVMIGTSKPFFNLLLDDRAGLYCAYVALESVLNYINDANSKSNQPREK